MKNTIRILGIIALAAIIGFGMMACSDGGGGEKPGPGPGPDVNTAFSISGTFKDTDGDVDAKFIATSTVQPSLSWSRSARAAADELVEVALEGLLEDGDITFRLKGSYNSETKIYSLSAASSKIRYSIAGDLSVANSSKAVVQVKAGTDWIVIEIDSVNASTDGEAPSISESDDIEDELANGIPEEMWGVWWGLESYEKGKGDIIQSGSYYYAVDAYTVIEYVNRSNIWNREGYTCFFEGADVDAQGVASGRVEFDYTDFAKIDAYDEQNGSWWVKCIADYAKQATGGGQDAYDRIMAVTDNANQGWQLWSDPEWTAFMNEWSAKSETSGFTGKRYTELFQQPNSEYFYKQYKKDAFRINSDKTLQMGNYYESSISGVYFSKNPETVEGFNYLKWATNTFNKEKATAVSAPATSQIVKGTLSNGLTIPSELTAVMHNSFEGKNNVLQVLSGFHWSVLYLDLAQYGGREVTFNVSMDVWLKTGARIAWQINQEGYMDQDPFPLVAGEGWDEVFDTGEWHSISASDVTLTIGSGKSLYLSTMQLLITAAGEDAIPSLVENEIYIANISITATPSGTLPTPPTDITGNLGNYAFGGIYEGGELVGHDYGQAVWGLSGENLGKAQADDSVLTIELTYQVSNLSLVWGAEVNGWWSDFAIIENGVAASGVTYSANTITVNLKNVITDFALFKTATFANLMLVDFMAVNINGLGITNANLTGTYDGPIEPPVVPTPTPIGGNMGNYAFGENAENEPSYVQAVWEFIDDKWNNLKSAEAIELTLKNAPTTGMNIAWQSWSGLYFEGWNDKEEVLTNDGSVSNGVTWNSTTKKLTIDLATVLTNYSEFITKNGAKIIIACYGLENINDLGITSANLIAGSASSVTYDLGAKYTWTAKANDDAPDHDSVRGWELDETIRAKIADGSIKYFVIGLDAAAVQTAGGLGSIGIILNADGMGAWNQYDQAFPWYWDKDAPEGTTGWISYTDLIGDYGAGVVDGVVYLQYDITAHPGYSGFKTAVGSATWAQFGLNVNNAWKDDAEWHEVKAAIFKE